MKNHRLFSKLPMVCLVLLFIIMLSCKQGQPSLSAEVIGLNNDTVFVFVRPLSQIEENDSDLKKDTLIAKNNKFEYSVSDDEDVLLYIIPNSLIRTDGGRRQFSFSGLIPIVVELGEKIKLKGEVEPKYFRYIVGGDGFNVDYSVSRESHKDLLLKMDSINDVIYFYTMSPQAPPNQDSLIYSLFSKRRELAVQQDEIIMEYVKNNLNKDLAAYYLQQQSIETFIRYYDQLSESVKNGVFKVQLDHMTVEAEKYMQKIENEAKVKVGETAPDFTLKDINGNDFPLSSIKDKYIVLDFWGSWCGPCMSGFPRMKEYYNKYKDQIEFVGIACRDKENSWKKAVSEQDLKWPQLINASDDPKKDVTVMYAIQAYPTKIILDKELKVVAFIRGESAEFYDKLDEILSKD